MTTVDWLWFGFVAMAVGSVILFVIGWNRRTRDEENHFLLHLPANESGSIIGGAYGTPLDPTIICVKQRSPVSLSPGGAESG